MITLTVADNEDATGATATVAGVANPTGWLVTAYRVTGAAGELASEDFAGDRSGSVVMGLAKGYYFAIARDTTDQSLSAMTYFRVTDGADAVASQVRDAIKARIELLALPGCQEVAIQMTPDESNLKFPCVLITPHDLQETDEQFLSTLDDIGRPNRVMICHREDAIDHAVIRVLDKWRQDIERAFRNQQMPSPREVVRMRVEYDYIINPNLPKFQFMVSEFVIRVVTREPRGLGA